jgi:hypothetical protein
MMKHYRTTLTLLLLFFVSLLTLVGLERAGILTEREKERREVRVLPELIDAPVLAIRKIAIERGSEHLVFERRGNAPGRWQMRQPLDVAAAPTPLETLVGTLKELRKSPDAGTISRADESFGLDPPAAIVRIYGAADAKGASSEQPLATLALGKAVHGMRYLRSEGGSGIDVADSKLLSAVDAPLVEWREVHVVPVATFQIASFSIKRPNLEIRGERGGRGQWNLTRPILAPGNFAKVESFLAALSSLRVLEGAQGFVADDVKDFAPYGLDSPSATVELTTAPDTAEPYVLHVGKAVPGQPDRVYVREGDQDDVVWVGAKAVGEIPTTAIALRSQRIADIEPAAVTAIQIDARNVRFNLKKDASGWEQTSPRAAKADTAAVNALLVQIDSIQASEFLDPKKVRSPELTPPVMTIKVWQSAPTGPGKTAPAAGAPVLNLHIGRHDVFLKSIFAQLEGDTVVLALPDLFVNALPKNELAFREREVLRLAPAQVSRLVLTRAGRVDELVPSKSGEANQWRMLRPIEAPADSRSVTQALAALTNLRADEFITESAPDLKLFGLDKPLLEVAWESDRSHKLKVGGQVPKTAAYYAMIEGESYVFTLKAEALKIFEAEFHDHLVMSFPLATAERLILNWGWPRRTVVLKHRAPATPQQPDWVAEAGQDVAGIDLSSMPALVKALSHLESIRYFQYEGEIPVATGLDRPRFQIEVSRGSKEPPRVLRIGYSIAGGLVMAAEGTAASGPVFVLPAAAWDHLIQSGERSVSLPNQVFAPER